MLRKIMLIFPPYTREALSSFPPLGIRYLASYILNKNPSAEIKIIDYSIREFSPKQFELELKTFDPQIVGISVLTLNFLFGTLIAKLTKQYNQEIIVVMGGVHATMLPEECLAHCDVVIRGEGEETFWEIVKKRQLDSIDGISFRRNGMVIHNKPRMPIRDLDGLPFPAYHSSEVKKYECFPEWGVMGSRGCPYQCIFCSSPKMWGNHLRLRSARNIVEEIEHLHRMFGINRIVFFDDTLNIPQRRAFEICNEIIRRGLHTKMSFACQMRANKQLVSFELFKKMSEANFIRVELGIESGSQRVLDSIAKSLKVDEARRAVNLAHMAGIPTVVGFFMVGSWDETPIDVLKTWLFVLTTPVWPVFSVCTPYPGTRLFTILEERNCMPACLDWSTFNMRMPTSRTNKMSRIGILLFYVCSYLLFQLMLTFLRGRTLTQTLRGLKRLLRFKTKSTRLLHIERRLKVGK